MLFCRIGGGCGAGQARWGGKGGALPLGLFSVTTLLLLMEYCGTLPDVELVWWFWLVLLLIVLLLVMVVLPLLCVSMLRIGVGGGGGFMFGGRGGATVGRPTGITENRCYDRFLY